MDPAPRKVRTQEKLLGVCSHHQRDHPHRKRTIMAKQGGHRQAREKEGLLEVELCRQDVRDLVPGHG